MLAKETNDPKKTSKTESNQRLFYNDLNVYIDSYSFQPVHHFGCGYRKARQLLDRCDEKRIRRN